MNNLKITRSIEIDEYQKILFERPISKLQSKNIGILAGKHAPIKIISDIFQTITTLNHNPVLITQLGKNDIELPSQYTLLPNIKKSTALFSNTDGGIDLLRDCSYVVAGIETELDASMQLFIEKLIKSRPFPIIFNDQFISIAKVDKKIFLNRRGDIYICQMPVILKFAQLLDMKIKNNSDMNVLTKLEVIKILATKLQADIVAVDTTQILAVSYKKTESGFIANLNNSKKINISNYLTALLACFMCDSKSQGEDFILRVATSAHLLKECLKSEGNFIKNLKMQI